MNIQKGNRVHMLRGPDAGKIGTVQACDELAYANYGEWLMIVNQDYPLSWVVLEDGFKKWCLLDNLESL